MPWRVVFFGTAEIACASLEALAANPEFQVVTVVTQPDKPRGRDLQVQPSAVKTGALKLNLPVLQPRRARDPDFIEQIRALTPDIGVVLAYGQILPQTLLDVPKHGCVNVHTSLLPLHRGAAPIQWAILNGDSESGVTIMKMDAGLDTGPILTQRTTPISADDTSQTLHDRLAILGAELLVLTLPRYIFGELQPVAQPEGATYARKIEKSDGCINWHEPAAVIERKIRAFVPWPGAFTCLKIGGVPKLVKVWAARAGQGTGSPGSVIKCDRSELLIACGEGTLNLIQVQLEGRKRMNIQDFLAGHGMVKIVSPAVTSKAATPGEPEK